MHEEPSANQAPATLPVASSALAIISATRPLRSLLQTSPSPDAAHEYLVELNGPLGPNINCHLRYVPDRLILNPASLAHYREGLLGLLDDTAPPPLEGLAIAILDDLNNELIPRWLQIHLAYAEGNHLPTHRVALEDSQPNWSNASLLGRVPAL